MTDTVPASLRKQLEQHGQSHLVRWWGALSPGERAALAAQIEQVDFTAIRTLWEEARSNAGSGPAAGAADSPALRAEPPRSIVRLPRTEQERAEWDRATQTGRELLSAGRVGVVLVAGGQGTRLGFAQPKGMFPVAPISGATLYQLLAEQVLARSRQAGVAIPYFVMTSEATSGATRAFFEANGCFGLDRDDVYFFQQGDMPAVDASSGRLLLAEKGKLSRSPDGHGGLLQALAQAGLLEVMHERGVDMVFYHQVDNPTVIVCDPAFLGWHALRQAEISLKVVAKRSAEERMGVVVGLDGKTCIIEYSDFPPDVAAKTDAEGKLVHWAGSTAIHVFGNSRLRPVDPGARGPRPGRASLSRGGQESSVCRRRRAQRSAGRAQRRQVRAVHFRHSAAGRARAGGRGGPSPRVQPGEERNGGRFTRDRAARHERRLSRLAPPGGSRNRRRRSD